MIDFPHLGMQKPRNFVFEYCLQGYIEGGYYFFRRFSTAGIIKVPILKEVTSEKCNSVELNTFSTYLSSLLGVIAIVFSNHAQK